MMDRLLALKKAISEYFRLHASNARELTSHEWTVTNEVCSLLDVVSEATTRMQGVEDTHVSQVMFIMTEVIELPRKSWDGETYQLRRYSPREIVKQSKHKRAQHGR